VLVKHLYHAYQPPTTVPAPRPPAG
jgi:hypothetical protein